MPGQGQSLASVRSGNRQRARQDRTPPGRRDVPAPYHPTRTQLRSARAQRAAYVSQGKAVEHVANRQRRTARQRAKLNAARAQGQYYASLGRQVERQANVMNRQTAAANPPHTHINLAHALAAIRNRVGAELAGKGELAHLVDAVMKQNRTITSTGAGPPVLLPHHGGVRALGTGPQTVPLTGTGKAVIEDLLNIPATAVSSLYVPAAGLVEAARGRPQRLQGFVKGIKQQDPYYNLAAAGVEAAQGHSVSARKHLAAANRSFNQHPGFALAEAYGIKGAVGRGAGAAMRTGALGKTAKRAAATEGTPRSVPGTTLKVPRTYSPDVLRKLQQVHGPSFLGGEKSGIRRAAQLRREAARAEKDNPDHAKELRRKADRIDPNVVKASEINRRVDETVAALEDIRRAHRSTVLKAVDKALGKGKHGAVSVVAQRIAHATPEDLGKYLKEIKAEHGKLAKEPALRRANEALQRHLQDALDHPEKLPEVAKAADRYASVIQPLQGKLAELGVLHDEQVRKAALTPYAVRHMGATHDGTRLVDGEGKPLTSDMIEAHMRANGVKTPAFITQAPNMRGGRNYNVRPERAVTIRSRRRTGQATTQGTFDAHPDTLREGAARAQGIIDAVQGHRKIIGEFGYRSDSGKVRLFQDRRQAEKFVANLHAGTDSRRWRIVRVNPLGARGSQLESLVNDITPEDTIKSSWQQQIDALHGEGKGPLAVIPEEAATRLEEHLASQGANAGLKSLRVVNSAFRRTVLSTSPTWLAGNVTEAAARSALFRAGPRAWWFGHEVLRRLEGSPGFKVAGIQIRKPLEALDAEAGLETRVRAVGGGHYSMAERQHIHTAAEQFVHTPLEGLAVSLGKFWRSPGPKQAASAYNAYTHFVFEMVNRTTERQFQTAMFGRALLRSGQRAVEDAAQGLKNTENQVRFGREVDRAYGKYSKFGPSTRGFIATYTPFVAWALNAAKFVADVLPRDHPVALAVTAASVRATEEWRKKHGLDLFMQGAVPGFLQGSIPVGKDGKLRMSRYLPFGAFGDPTGTAANQVLPQYMGIINAFNGKDWKGDDLRVNGKPVGADPVPKFLAGVMAVVGATVPVYSEAMRIAHKGPAALNPFTVTHPKKPKNAASTVVVPTGGGGSSSAGGLPDSVQRALENQALQGGGGAELPESVQQALERLAK